MKEFLEKLRQQVAENPPNYGDADSVLGLLYSIFFTKYLHTPFRNTPFFRCFGTRHIFHIVTVLSSNIINIIILG